MSEHMLLTFYAQASTDLSFLNSSEVLLCVCMCACVFESLDVEALDLKRTAQALEPGCSGFNIQPLSGSKSLGKFLLPAESWFLSQNQYENNTGSQNGVLKVQ